MKKKLILPLVIVSLLLLQACGDVLTPATPMPTKDEQVSVGEEQQTETSEAETSVSETSLPEASVSESIEASVSETLPEIAPEDYYYGEYKELAVGDRAPWIQVKLLDDTDYDTAYLQGKVILLNFWATWCGPCVREMPALESLYADYGDDGDVVILGVDFDEDPDTIRAFVAENGFTFHIAYDPVGIVSWQYPTDGIPYTVVVGKDGYIKNIHLGASDAETMYKEYKSDIEAALAE